MKLLLIFVIFTILAAMAFSDPLTIESLDYVSCSSDNDCPTDCQCIGGMCIC